MHPESVYPPAPERGHRQARQVSSPRAFDPLRPYKIGLAVIGLFTVGITIFALMAASAAKQDTKTEDAANSIATRLDTYITDKQKIPDSLSAAGVKGDNPHIKYTKVSDSAYTFCITFKSASSTAVNPLDQLTGRSIYKRLAANYGSGSGYLYISPVHKKGQNCQTVHPYIDGSSSYDDSQGPDTSDYQFDTDSSTSDFRDPKTLAQEAAKSDKVCYFTGYQTHYSGIVSSIAGSQDSGQDFTLKVQPDSGGPSGEQTITVKANDTSTFRNGCSSMFSSSFKIGDHVAVFVNNKDDFMPDTIVDYNDEQ